MSPEVLIEFLANVRQKTFVDYLDPMGETAQQALARRIRWATVSRTDPSHADEAEFLLRHEKELKEVLLKELEAEQDGWGVDGDDGGEAWGKASPYSSGSAAVVDMETGEETEVARPSAGITRMEDLTPDEASPRLNVPSPSGSRTTPAMAQRMVSAGDVEIVGGYSTPGAAPDYFAVPTDMKDLPEQDVGYGNWSDDSVDDSPAMEGDEGWRPTPNPFSVPETADPFSDTGGEMPTPSAFPSGDDGGDPDSTDEEEAPRSVMDIRASRRPDQKAINAHQKALKERTRTNTGYRLVPMVLVVLVAIGAGGGIAIGVGGITVDQIKGVLGLGAVAVIEEADAPTPLGYRAPEVEPAPEPAPVEPGEADTDAVEDGDGVVEDTDAPTVGEAGATEAPTPAPAPVAPVVKLPPTPVAPVPTPKPVAPKPAPKPKPAAPKPAPPEPKPAPEPAPEFPDVKGTWSGIAASRSLKVVIDSQNNKSIAGRVEIQNPDGSWDKFSVIGSVTSENVIKFSQSGGGAMFKGVFAIGIKLSGTVTLADGTSGKFTAIR
jgi:hypothetical protein